jgi:TetR/AcrR family transcriptional regulator, cholesterol catabolism regulator
VSAAPSWEAPAARRRSRPSNDRRQQIIEVSTELFRERGYHVTSLEDIAERIGFTKPAIYYYFKSKEDILFAIVEEIVDEAYERIASIAAGPGPCVERLRALLVANTEAVLTNRDANAVFYNERGLLSTNRERMMRAREREYTRLVRDLYTEGVEQGELFDVDPSVATATLLGASIWTYRWVNPTGSLSIPEVAEMVADLLLNGFRR